MKIMRILINITLPIFLIMLFASLLTTKGYLLLSKEKYESHTSEYFDFDYDYAADRIMGYLNYRYDNLEFGADENDPLTIVTADEIFHMKDVKTLYTGLRIIAIISLVVAVSLSYVLFKKDKEELYKTYKSIYIGPLVFIFVVGGAMIINFDGAFELFHKIFFSNDLWLLGEHDVLILVLPEMFWMISGMIVLVLFALSLGIIYFVNEKIHSRQSS